MSREKEGFVQIVRVMQKGVQVLEMVAVEEVVMYYCLPLLQVFVHVVWVSCLNCSSYYVWTW